MKLNQLLYLLMDKKGNEKYYKLKEFEKFTNASQLYVF